MFDFSPVLIYLRGIGQARMDACLSMEALRSLHVSAVTELEEHQSDATRLRMTVAPSREPSMTYINPATPAREFKKDISIEAGISSPSTARSSRSAPERQRVSTCGKSPRCPVASTKASTTGTTDA